MAWWSAADRRYAAWGVDGVLEGLADPAIDEEACYGVCLRCEAVIVGVIRFEGPCATVLVSVHVENDWPETHRR
jgi:hypothetical protein